ncbi:unnamed protein product [Symbiodinium sp. KB8]|nr:unnamed protein product [Symbiodinium sp. KB8]
MLEPVEHRESGSTRRASSHQRANTASITTAWHRALRQILEHDVLRPLKGAGRQPACADQMAGREVVPRTWPSGLNAAERIKAEREQQGGAEDEEVFDELLWNQQVTDLHRVMEVAKSVWLLLEHSNEAMVRVALEIALDRNYKKVLWWPDFWFSDHDKREYFKEIVRIKLAIAIANAKGSAVDLSEFQKNEEESELVIGLRKKISELEEALRMARQAQEAAEARCRELEAAAAEAAQRMAAMEKSLEQLRKEVKDAYRNSLVDKGSDASEEEIVKLKQQLKMSEEQRVKLEEMIAQLKKQLQQASASGDASAQLNAELQAARKRIEDLENRLKEAQKEIAALKKQKSPAPAKTEGKATVDGEAFRRLSAELEEERRKREELEELLQKAQEEIELLKKDLDAERKKAAELSAELKRLQQLDGKKPEVLQEVQQVSIPGGMTDEQLAELEELRAKAAELEKLKAKLKKRDAQIAALQEENDKLNEEQMRLLKMLKQVREQLRIVMELAEKKGLGDVIKKLFEEAGLGTTMSDPDYTCFDRLYDDALRRMDKQRRLEWYRLGNTGEPPPSFKGGGPPMRPHNSPPCSYGDAKRRRGCGAVEAAAAVAPFLHPGLCRKACLDQRRGQGVFASKLLRAGELLLASPPLAAVKGVPEEQLSAALADVVSQQLDGGDPLFGESFWSLSEGLKAGAEARVSSEAEAEAQASSRREKVLRIIAVNAHGWPQGDEKGLGLWPWQAYMNHAPPADANCSAVFAGEVLLMRAIKSINAEEECLHSYCPPSASFTVRRAILRQCCVPHVDQEVLFQEEAAAGGLHGELQGSLLLARDKMKVAASAVHEDDNQKAHTLWKEVLSLRVDHRRCSESTGCAAPAIAEFLRLQLRAARCLGDMLAAAASHAELARALRREQPKHVEVLAHWLGHLRAGGEEEAALEQVQALSRFWLGSSAGLAEASEWMAKQAYRRRESPERAQDPKQRANHTGQIYCRNCGNAVEVPTNMVAPAPSLPATRSPSPQDRGGAYYRTQSTESLSSQKRSQSPQSRSLSPSAPQAVDLRIESVRPANNGQIALSVVTWGEPRAPSWRSLPGAAQSQTFPHGGARSRSPEKSEAPRRRGERGSLPPLQDVGPGQQRGVRMMGSSSATELRRDPVRDEAQNGLGPGRLRGAMFVNSYRPFAADLTKEEPRMMWRPQKSFPLKDAPGLREHA